MKNHFKIYEKVCGDLKPSGNGWFMTYCPYPDHEDKKRSFAVNEGAYHTCFGCSARGDAYLFAKDFGYDPRPYARGRVKGDYMSPSTPILPPKTGNKQDVSVLDVCLDIPSINDGKQTGRESGDDNVSKHEDDSFKTPLMDVIMLHHNHLLNESEEVSAFLRSYSWKINKKAVERHLLGYDQRADKIMIPIFDKEKKPYGWKFHKGHQTGYNKKNKWYPQELIVAYDKNKPILICAGEKDAIHVMDHTGWQVATVTGGEMSIPKINNWIVDGFKKYIIIYDNAAAGWNGATKMAKELGQRNILAEVSIAQWGAKETRQWDCSLSFQNDGGSSFAAAIDNAEKVTITKIGGFDLILPNTITKESVKPVEWYVDTIRPKGFASLLAGETGSNKSHLVMQEAMCIATGIPFLGNYVKRPAKVLYVDTEVGQDELMRRYLAKVQTGMFDPVLLQKNFSMVSKRGNFDDVYTDVEKALHILKPEVCYIDNMYTSTDIIDLSKNHNIKQLLQRILRIMHRHDVTVVLVAHFNKPDGNVENSFNINKIAGGSYLANWSEHIQILCNTNQDNLRLFRTVKSRGTEFTKAVYGLEWGGKDNQLLMMDGLYSNWKWLLVDNQKMELLMSCLEDVAEIGDPFDANRWCNVCTQRMEVSDRTARRYLHQLVTMKLVDHTGKDGNARLYKRTKLSHKNWKE